MCQEGWVYIAGWKGSRAGSSVWQKGVLRLLWFFQDEEAASRGLSGVFILFSVNICKPWALRKGYLVLQKPHSQVHLLASAVHTETWW